MKTRTTKAQRFPAYARCEEYSGDYSLTHVLPNNGENLPEHPERGIWPVSVGRTPDGRFVAVYCDGGAWSGRSLAAIDPHLTPEILALYPRSR